MWKNGRTAMIRSSSCRSISARVCATLATRLRWLSMTPLGRPVVPLEYGRVTRSFAGSMSTWTEGASAPRRSNRFACPSIPSRTTTSSTGDCPTATAARSMNREIVMRILAPESFSWKAISSGV
jgi:hypothetical protein